MTQLHSADIVENRAARTIGWLVSLPVAVSLFGLLVWLSVSLQWKIGAGVLVFTFGAAAVGVFINRVVQKRLMLHWLQVAHNRVAEPGLTISKAPLHLGDSFQITYRQQTVQSLEIKHFTIQLVRRTRKIYHRNVSGIKETVEKKRERIVQTSKQPGGYFQPGDTFYQAMTLTIPNNDMLTSQTDNRYERWLASYADNRYDEWLLRVHLSIKHGPTSVSEYPLQVIAKSTP